MDRAALTQLRSLVLRGDVEGLVAALNAAPWPADSLQLIGDGLVAAVRGGTDGSVELSRACVIALGERRWDGDRELADALEAALGTGPAPMLRPLPVDLEELSMILEGDPIHGGGRIDLRTGEVWPQAAIEYAEEVGEIGEEYDDDPNRWLWVDSEGSRPGYRDMEWFIEDLDDADFADRLARAIAGSGAFRRFKERLSERPGLITRWHTFSNDRQRGRARRWLADEGYTDDGCGETRSGRRRAAAR
ncbi:hypothetical protein D0Z08_19340 [Nocardioides immobilis]|uniref:Uncharacterized protein n=1 Tax=Nocardioides immobilis TaxID=2049295 RepID=A0A417XYE6_9ACTN|nr:UPF0158 family protein [Nocardioides immobilis]RHW25385.1 hypothetical protein D0Z08_19340 [Nocardioides immobilis]